MRNVTFGELDQDDFDRVCAFEVLEHIEDDAGPVRDWAGRLCADGSLMLSL